jgi:hypothetical protein
VLLLVHPLIHVFLPLPPQNHPSLHHLERTRVPSLPRTCNGLVITLVFVRLCGLFAYVFLSTSHFTGQSGACVSKTAGGCLSTVPGIVAYITRRSHLPMYTSSTTACPPLALISSNIHTRHRQFLRHTLFHSTQPSEWNQAFPSTQGHTAGHLRT